MANRSKPRVTRSYGGAIRYQEGDCPHCGARVRISMTVAKGFSPWEALGGECPECSGLVFDCGTWCAEQEARDQCGK